MRRVLPALLLVLALAVLSGCESTFDKAAKLRAEQGTIADVVAVEGVHREEKIRVPIAKRLTSVGQHVDFT